MNESMENKIPRQLRKRIEINYNESQWYSKPSTFKTPEKRKKNKISNETNKGESKRRSKKNRSNSQLLDAPKYLSPSAKMDTKIPKIEDLLRDREEAKRIEEMDKLIKKSSTQFLKQLKSKDLHVSEKPKLTELHCKHLTVGQLNKKFHKDIEYLDGIFYGINFNERHRIFYEQLDSKNCTLKQDLRVSDSLGVFTNDQLVHLVTLFRERYDNGNKYKYSDYYFKVLLPEYCLKIFSDVYNMESTEALEYLKFVPIPNLFGLLS